MTAGRPGPGPRPRPRPTLALALSALLLGACSTTHRSALNQTTAPTSEAPSSVGPPTTDNTSTTAACTPQSVIASWSLPRRAAELVVAPILDANPSAVQTALAHGVGGLLLFGPPPPAAQLIADLRPAKDDKLGPAPLIMADEEGGEVQRLVPDVASLPSARQMAATVTTAAVQQEARSLAGQMAGLGVTVDLAPVLDLDGGPALNSHDPDGPRSFSTDPSVAAAYGNAFATGLQQGGVLAVAKHFPGLGGATSNTDYGPASTMPIASLQAAGLVPFERAVAAGVKAVMVSNASVPGLTTKPSSVSAPVITGLLRQQLGFGGLVMTDSLSAGAITTAGYQVPAAAVAAVEAGADMILYGSTLTAADTAQLAPGPLGTSLGAVIDALVGAVQTGALPTARLDDAVLHVIKADGAHLCGPGQG